MRSRLFIGISVFFTILSIQAEEHAITVYNQNRALVKTVQTLEIPKNISTLAIENVAAQIDPTSVYFKSLTTPDKLSILEQNYEYDLAGANTILRKYLGESIRFVTENGEVFDGTLLSVSRDDIVLQKSDGSIQIVQDKWIQQFDFPELPEGLRIKPSLVWMINNSGQAKHQTELSYLTSGMNWHAEYVAVTDAEDKMLDLSGWVSIENSCGTTFKDAKLKLVAGDVNVIQRAQVENDYAVMARAEKAGAAPQFREESLFEYHLYTLQRKTTLKNNQTKQVSLFPSTQTPVQKIYQYNGTRYGNKVRVILEFRNEKKKGLGIPLPKGKIRVYKEDSDKDLIFIGEDYIDHTPKDEKVSVFVGNAFDITGERNQISEKRISNRSRELEVEVVLRNHKEESVQIVVDENLYGDWQILESSHKHEKKDARTLRFCVDVPKDGEVKVNYKALLKW